MEMIVGLENFQCLPASPASTHCANVNTVVASVCTPNPLSFRHACNPSHVAGTFTTSRESGKSGSRRAHSALMPSSRVMVSM